MTKTKENVYVAHFCRNPKCNNVWLDEDLTNAKSRAPRWKFCSECCSKYSLVNADKPPKKIRSEKQLEIIKKNKFTKRKKSSVIGLI